MGRATNALCRFKNKWNFPPFLPDEPMKTTLLSLLLLNASAFAQTVGGGYQTIRQLDGYSNPSGYGNSLASIGDLNHDGYDDLLIGNPLTDIGANFNIGAVMIRSGADGSILMELVGSEAGDRFGNSVAAVSDINMDGYEDFVIGAPNASSATLADTGSATVHSGIDGTQLLQWFGPGTGDLLGLSVSGIGDFNADGTPDILVGAPASTARALPQCGAVYVYSGTDGSILFHDYGDNSGDWLGYSVSEAGDVDQDGSPDLIAGAIGGSSSGWGSSGEAYVYSGATGTRLWEWYGAATNSLMGYSVADAGDVNGDGHPDLLVGTPGAGFNQLIDCGSASLFSGADGSLLYQWYGVNHGWRLGNSVSGAGDVDQDGYPDLLGGAPDANLWGGAVILYSGANGSTLNTWQGSAFDEMGTCVAKVGDINNDGYPDFAFNAPSAGNADHKGEVDICSFTPFLESTTTTISAAETTMVGLDLSFPLETAGFGYRVLISSSGNSPFQYGVDIPLTLDSAVVQSFFGNYFFLTQSNMQGALNMNGQGVAHIGLLPGDTSHLVGRTFWVAAIANPAGELPTHSSISIPLQIIL
jgi:hypothetical protein